MTFLAAEHEARFRGVLRVTVTCSCGWVDDRRLSRRNARLAYAAHLLLGAFPDAVQRRRRDLSLSDDLERPG